MSPFDFLAFLSVRLLRTGAGPAVPLRRKLVELQRLGSGVAGIARLQRGMWVRSLMQPDQPLLSRSGQTLIPHLVDPDTEKEIAGSEAILEYLKQTYATHRVVLKIKNNIRCDNDRTL